uniref:Secreted protein n=1 Tax=Panagrellus redivivus TaxID=6233 RepID=A0A7E4VHQ5_PANRE
MNTRSIQLFALFVAAVLILESIGHPVDIMEIQSDDRVRRQLASSNVDQAGVVSDAGSSSSFTDIQAPGINVDTGTSQNFDNFQGGAGAASSNLAG